MAALCPEGETELDGRLPPARTVTETITRGEGYLYSPLECGCQWESRRDGMVLWLCPEDAEEYEPPSTIGADAEEFAEPGFDLPL